MAELKWPSSTICMNIVPRKTCAWYRGKIRVGCHDPHFLRPYTANTESTVSQQGKLRSR